MFRSQGKASKDDSLNRFMWNLYASKARPLPSEPSLRSIRLQFVLVAVQQRSASPVASPVASSCEVDLLSYGLRAEVLVRPKPKDVHQAVVTVVSAAGGSAVQMNQAAGSPCRSLRWRMT